MIYRPVTARAQEGPYRDICVSMDTLSLQISLRYMLGHTHRQTRSRSRGVFIDNNKLVDSSLVGSPREHSGSSPRQQAKDIVNFLGVEKERY